MTVGILASVAEGGSKMTMQRVLDAHVRPHIEALGHLRVSLG